MRRTAVFALVMSAMLSGGIAFSVTHCAEPTQIILDVRIETSLCNEVKRTGIAVTSIDQINTAPLEVFEGPGCEEPGDRIGTLSITPSGEKDDEVGIRVIAGIDRPADQCVSPFDGCIVARRKLRFAPGETKVEIVILRRACIGQDCKGLECFEGACVDPDIVLPDGGTVTDSGGDTNVPPTDAPVDVGLDVIPDALPDANPCNRCKGTCVGTTCNVDCNATNCENPNNPPCGHGLDCNIDCSQNDCDGLLCATDGGCKVVCKQGNSCQNVTCNANTCAIDCQVTDSCRTIIMSGGDAGMACGNADNSCREVARCDAGRCVIQCDNQGQGTNCPTTRDCASGSVCVGYP